MFFKSFFSMKIKQRIYTSLLFISLKNNKAQKNPTQTLDVDGNARIRDVPFGEFDSVLVINGDGVLHWRNFESGVPGTTLGGNIAVTAEDSGIILKAKDGENYYRILVDNNGTLYTEQVNIK